jgi:hypothetical protein
MPRKLKSTALSPTALSDNLGYTPVSPTQLNDIIDSAPAPYPTDGENYTWDEATISWLPV